MRPKILKTFIIKLLLLYTFAFQTFAQSSEYGVPFHLEGPLVAFCHYKLKLSQKIVGFAKFDDYFFPLDTLGDNYFFLQKKISNWESRYLSIYSINSAGDTALYGQEKIEVVYPEFDVFFDWKCKSGDTINVTQEKLWSIGSTVRNTGTDFTFKLDTSTIRIFIDGKIKEYSFLGNSIPFELRDKILESHSELMIINLRIKLNDKIVFLKPVVYYLRYD